MIRDTTTWDATSDRGKTVSMPAKEGIRLPITGGRPDLQPLAGGLADRLSATRGQWMGAPADSPTGIHPRIDLPELLMLPQDRLHRKMALGRGTFLPRNQGSTTTGLLHNLDPVETVFSRKGRRAPDANGKVVKRPAEVNELTKVCTDEALDFIERSKEEPFFLYLPHTMLHAGLGVSEEFKGTSKWGEYGDAIQELDHNGTNP